MKIYINCRSGRGLHFQGKEIRGILEGATEYITQQVLNTKKSTKKEKLFYGKEVRFNQKENGYDEVVSIVKQMDIILGNDLISNFALTGDTKALKEFQNIYGKELLEKIRKGTNKLLKINGKEKVGLLQDLQNNILYECYNKKFEQISNTNDGIDLLKELKEFELARGKIEGDDSFKNYYIQKYNEIMEYAKDNEVTAKDREDLEYKEPEFYKIHSEEEIRKILKGRFKSISFNYGIEDVSRLKRFQYQDNGNTYEIMCIDDKPIRFTIIGEYDNYQCSSGLNEKDNYKIKFMGGKEGKINLNKNENGEYSSFLDYENVHNQEMNEIELGFSQEEYDEFKEENKEQEKKTWISRIKEWIDNKREKREEIKALPEPKENKSWKLTEEDKEKVDEFNKKIVEGKEDLVIENIHTNNEYDERT